MRWFERIESARPPDFVIGLKNNPYMQRWWVIPRNKIFNIYLHKFLHSDDDRALHDHPWVNVSILLSGEYTEHTIAAGGVSRAKHYVKGDVKFRWPWSAHRIEISDPCWSLFITGPVMREWGFHCPKGWRHWKQFTDARDKGQIGIGCGEHDTPGRPGVLELQALRQRFDYLNISIANATGWGAALGAMNEERKEIRAKLKRHGVDPDAWSKVET